MKRRNTPCDAPLCVVSSFFPMGKEERGGAAQGGFLLFILFTTIRKLVESFRNTRWNNFEYWILLIVINHGGWSTVGFLFRWILNQETIWFVCSKLLVISTIYIPSRILKFIILILLVSHRSHQIWARQVLIPSTLHQPINYPFIEPFYKLCGMIIFNDQ